MDLMDYYWLILRKQISKKSHRISSAWRFRLNQTLPLLALTSLCSLERSAFSLESLHFLGSPFVLYGRMAHEKNCGSRC